MSVVSIRARTCPDCRHAEHEGRVCNAVGGLGACRCSPYEWVDISKWQEEEEKKEKKTIDVSENLLPLPFTRVDPFDQFEDWLFSPTVLWKVLLVAVVTLMLIIFFTSIYVRDIGF